MPFGLSPSEALLIATPFIGTILTGLLYLFQYDKHEYSRIASVAESERWESVKQRYGRLVREHHIEVVNTANLFLDVSNEDSYANTMAEVVEDINEFQELAEEVERLHRPKKYHKYCRFGAEFGPIVFLASFFSALTSLFVNGVMNILAIVIFLLLFVVAFALSIAFLYFRSKLNDISDEVQFRT